MPTDTALPRLSGSTGGLFGAAASDIIGTGVVSNKYCQINYSEDDLI